MATYGSTLRRGLPRVSGGEGWPPAGDAPVDGVAAEAAAPAPAAEAAQVAAPQPVAEAAQVAEPQSVAEPGEASGAPVSAVAAASASSATAARAVRRGLPRVAGGEPWPPASSAPAPATQAAESAATAVPSQPSVTPEAAPVAAQVAQSAATDASTRPSVAPAADVTVRRGLPRVAGGEPWPPASFVPAAAVAAPTVAEATVAVAVAEPVEAAVPAKDYSTPLPFPKTVHLGAAARERLAHPKPAPKPEPQRIGPFTKVQWAGAVVVLGGGLLVAAFLAVTFVRWFLSLEFMQDFLTTYPGEYHLPEGAPVGFPAWLGWQHFFNVFLMVLIIRSGLTIRTEKRPTAFWSPKNNKKRKISLTMWFHQALDILWLVNGVIFVVLLFVSGQWMRIVPTSWEVFPNALSAALQYVSLDWPTENGWVNYNSLQQIAYFLTVFVAAPLAAITGVRMSGVWPKDAKALNKAYPVEWARAVHFPVMLYFVLFIIVHVTLVFATGALRNLNHMYAMQGSTDPNEYLMNWTGFWIFLASLVVIIAGWIAARPLVIAPIARVFGTVSGR